MLRNLVANKVFGAGVMTTAVVLVALLAVGCGVFQSERSGETYGSCSEDPPNVLPDLPQVTTDAAGRAAFDKWRDFDCDEVSDVEDCSPDAPCSDGNPCLLGSSGEAGVCMGSFDNDIWCDGEGEVMTFGDGMCWVCVDLEVHAAACCRHPDLYDCRAWPYEGDGGPGTACARHDDCMVDLICGGNLGSGYGICQCPGLDPDSVEPDSACMPF